MDSTLYEMQAMVEHIIYRNEKNEYTVAEVSTADELVVAVGTLPMVTEGESLRLFGKWVNHPNFGTQFQVESFERMLPETTAGILKYLSSGTVKGIGKATARRIVDMFGENALEVMEKEPERLAEIRGITKEKAILIGEEFQRLFGIRELIAHLSRYQITPEQAVRIWKKYGRESVLMIERDPYSLCDEELGVDFQKADEIAAEMNCERDSEQRITAGILYVLRHNILNGHTCLPEDKLVTVTARMLEVEADRTSEVLQKMIETEIIYGQSFELSSGGKTFCFLKELFEAEIYSASRLSEALQFPPAAISGFENEIRKMERKNGIQYAEKQREAIQRALSEGILILTGKPGTGKTTTLNAIISILETAGEKVLLAAPTGRAAKRMSELTGREAKTIHRLLQVEWRDSSRPVFSKNEKNLLECDALVLDEMSMVDASLFASVLKALPLGCRLILVGDTHQLPSVGPGNILGDLIRSEKIPVIELDEIFRQAMESLIITNAHRVIAGEMPELAVRDRDFFFIPRNDSGQVLATVTDLCVNRLPQYYGADVQPEIQVIAPGRKGSLGVTELNRALQQALNPAQKDRKEIQINGTVFREGDRVMQVRNDYDLSWTKEDGTPGSGVFNGDIGTLLEIDHSAGVCVVQMDERMVLYTEDDLAELEHAYAITVHKSQGNEFRIVVMPVFPGPPQLCYRNLFYTGITRAREMLVLVGRRESIRKMVENDRKTRRYSGLRYMLQMIAE